MANTEDGAAVGSVNQGVALGKTYTNMTPGTMQETGEPLDFAIEGNGFFAVKTRTGNPLHPRRAVHDLGRGRADGHQRRPGARRQRRADQSRRGRHRARRPRSACSKSRAPSSRAKTCTPALPPASRRARCRQGSLEGSGVDAAKVMVEMITSLRSFQSGQQAIQSIGQTLQEAASQVGSLPAQASALARLKSAGTAADHREEELPSPAGPPCGKPGLADDHEQDGPMLEGLYSAAAGMSAQQEQLDAISNDLANLSTDGYKSERVAFSDLLYSPVDIAGTDQHRRRRRERQGDRPQRSAGRDHGNRRPARPRDRRRRATSRSRAPTARRR